MVGFSEHEMSDNLQKIIASKKAGNFIFFRQNIRTQVQSLAIANGLKTAVRAATGFAPFLAVDQEGGDVIRIKTQPAMPSAFYVGELASPRHAWNLGRSTGALLNTFGINMNLAPVLDVSSANRVEFLKLRSFGTNPVNVGRMGYYFAMGLKNQNVFPVAKHFPSIGESMGDPHDQMIRDFRTGERVIKEDLITYKGFFKMGNLNGVLLSHTTFQGFDPKSPASRSANVYRMLRDDYNFYGLAITDDLLMAGNGARSELSKNCVASIEAGADILLLSANGRALEECHAALKSKANSDGKFRLLLANRFQRIRRIKELTIQNPDQNANSSGGFKEAVEAIESSFFEKMFTELKAAIEMNDLTNETCLQKELASFLKGLSIPKSLSKQESELFKTAKNVKSEFKVNLRPIDGRRIPSSISQSAKVKKCKVEIAYTPNLSSFKRILKRKTNLNKKTIVFASHAFTEDDKSKFLHLSFLPKTLGY